MHASRVVQTSEGPQVARKRSIAALAEEATTCRNCELWERATQVVFGRGKRGAPLMLVGEQPGDAEDRAGEPFVGPAGKLLARALEEAGLGADDVYVTNAVKHFHWEERGKRRIHKKPRQSHIRACRPWLEAEIETVKPRVLVCLGSVAAQALMGASARVSIAATSATATTFGVPAVPTLHPAAILRAPDSEAREAGFARLVADLKLAARTARAAGPRGGVK